MTKKRRMFDIDLPDADVPPPAAEPFGASARRGPMATAIGETGEATRRRSEIEAEIRAENDALAHEFVRLKKLGLITDMIPIDEVNASKLMRDRSRRSEPEIEDLMASIRTLGLSNPIRVEPTAHDGYELVEGWRRLSAFRALYEETGDDRWSRIPASFVPPGETVELLYRRMVDENLVRKDISWAEMAQLARAYANDRVGGCDDLDQAVNLLFASANAQKRSYIRRFASLLARLEKHLEHPEAIPRALGLSLAQRLDVQPELVAQLVENLRRVPRRSADEELQILQDIARSEPVAISPRGNAGQGAPVRGRPVSRGKTVLRVPFGGDEVKCTAAPGRVELRLDRDFSTVDRARLETAIEAFFRAIDQR